MLNQMENIHKIIPIL